MCVRSQQQNCDKMKNLSFRLKSLRGNRSQAAISNILGVKQQNWARWESGVVQPNAETIHHICVTFHVSADWLLGLSDLPPSPSPPDRAEELKREIEGILRKY